ncbi:DEAD/DEAH box helicase [Escherichia coli]
MTDDFAPDGQLAKAIPGFKPREPQRQMAVAVTQAIEKGQPLVVEAGTGTGKTYAYLAPALRRRKSLSRPAQKRCRISSTAAICQQSQRH